MDFVYKRRNALMTNRLIIPVLNRTGVGNFKPTPPPSSLSAAIAMPPPPSNSVVLPPGFRFHPTDEELVLHYLRARVASAAATPSPLSIIAEVDIYKYDPWELPAKATYGEREWYFFSPRERKYPNGFRPNRAAVSGYWKATGTDKPICRSGKGNEKPLAVKKALVFYMGRPPKGVKTDWIMHEYRLADAHGRNSYKPTRPLRDSSMRLDDWVLCRIYKKTDRLQAAATPATTGQEDALNTYLDEFVSSWSFKDYSPEKINGIADFAAPRQAPPTNPSVLVAGDYTESSTKRQRTTIGGYWDGGGRIFQPSERSQNCESAYGANFVERLLECNSSSFLEQPFIDRSHLGFH
ncbi:hypothetical protein ZIOFF_013479 [Zingiber officinale]|uniref:NAC domain-containing protein n=2 Tax=Zingiber officinale TaxID=94328 RepID=A0A8J5HLN3_ZINOF|nr:hypothetical protein ZIOFF_013479 [Zingiber officinale]